MRSIEAGTSAIISLWSEWFGRVPHRRTDTVQQMLAERVDRVEQQATGKAPLELNLQGVVPCPAQILVQSHSGETGEWPGSLQVCVLSGSNFISKVGTDNVQYSVSNIGDRYS